MHALLLVALAMQVGGKVGVQRGSSDTTSKSKGVSVNVGVGAKPSRRHREPIRIPVTAEHLRTAFKSPLARLST